MAGNLVQLLTANLQKDGNPITYSQTYTYSPNQPHAAVHIGQQAYSYDANGNQTGWKHEVSGQRRQIVWDEENRVQAIVDRCRPASSTALRQALPRPSSTSSTQTTWRAER